MEARVMEQIPRESTPDADRRSRPAPEPTASRSAKDEIAVAQVAAHAFLRESIRQVESDDDSVNHTP